MPKRKDENLFDEQEPEAEGEGASNSLFDEPEEGEDLGDVDPLQELEELGDALDDDDGPEGGGSIRARPDHFRRETSSRGLVISDDFRIDSYSLVTEEQLLDKNCRILID